MRERSDSLQKTYEQIWWDYFEEGLERPALCTKYNRTAAGMKKIIALGEQQYPDRPRKASRRVDPRRTENRRPLTPIHLQIGARVARHMRENNLNCTDFGAMVNLSRIRVSELTSGYYDPKLRELQTISVVLGLTVMELMSPLEKVHAR